MASRSRTVRALIALTAVSACLGAAVAYAASRPDGGHTGLGGNRTVEVSPDATGVGTGAPNDEERLLRPRFIEYPEAITAVPGPQFRFHIVPRPQRLRPGHDPLGRPSEPIPARRFQCRLDDGGWTACSSPHRLTGLAPGAHSFAVRAFTRDGRPGPIASHSWRQLETTAAPEPERVVSQPFSIELRAGLDDLYPGDPAQQLSILISNPNRVPIEITSLSVAIAGHPPNCSIENFELTPSSVSPETPLSVLAGESVTLPSAAVSAPSIRMLNLPVNQDACRGAEVPLVFSGEAHG